MRFTLLLVLGLSGCLPAPECFRAVECVEHCGGPIVENAGCGHCSAGHLDIASCPVDASTSDAAIDSGADASHDGGSDAMPDANCVPTGSACDSASCCTGHCCLDHAQDGSAGFLICRDVTTCP